MKEKAAPNAGRGIWVKEHGVIDGNVSPSGMQDGHSLLPGEAEGKPCPPHPRSFLSRCRNTVVMAGRD